METFEDGNETFMFFAGSFVLFILTYQRRSYLYARVHLRTRKIVEGENNETKQYNRNIKKTENKRWLKQAQSLHYLQGRS